MKKLIIKRAVAFGIDYLIIIVYAVLLFGITTLIDPVINSPVIGQIVGFFTLTLPVFLYFYLTEKSKYKGTIGKKIMRISVINNQQNNNRNILIRNIIKFLPWEIAHIGVHWMYHYSHIEIAPPIWVWLLLIIPQIVILGYLISLIVYKGTYTYYDKIAHTKIGINNI